VLRTLAVVLSLVAATAHAQQREREPSARVARLIRTGDAYLTAGDRGSAIGYYREALAIDPFAGRAYEALGEAYRSRGSLEDARAVYETGVERVPDRPGLWLGLVRTLSDLGAERDAAEAVRGLLERAPDHPEGLAMRADLARRRGAWSEALTAYRALIANADQLDEATVADARRYEAALRLLAAPLDPVSAERACAMSPVRRALARCP
jgi:tetratricopeptide (TPR) repeat protein